jgi:DNA invertase Pin-like site-specific DNA recombinase
VTDYGFIRVSTGSQDAQTQRRDILRASPLAVIITTDTKAASASKGEQVDVLDAVIAELRKGDRVMVTDSSRLDRRENLWDQLATIMAILRTGATVLSLDPDEDDFAVDPQETVARQKANAAKSKKVKAQTWRGVQTIRDNKAHHGALPTFWASRGVRYAKQAYCEKPAAVADIYERVASGESLASVGRAYDIYPNSVKNIIRFAANHTGVEECSYTHDGETETWAHEVEPVVDSPLWWRANRVLDVNVTNDRANKGGRPVAQAANWISGILDCPGCGGKVYLNAGLTPQGKPRTPKLRCGGYGKKRLSCGQFKGIDARPVIYAVTAMFAGDTTDILAFQRVSGNAHELDELKASVAKIQGRLSATEDDSELDRLVAERKGIKAAIEGFVVIPDSFDYAPTGQTVAGMWNGDDAAKRNMVKAVKDAWSVALSENGGQWEIKIGADFEDNGEAAGIVDLGNGLCFRRVAA